VRSFVDQGLCYSERVKHGTSLAFKVAQLVLLAGAPGKQVLTLVNLSHRHHGSRRIFCVMMLLRKTLSMPVAVEALQTFAVVLVGLATSPSPSLSGLVGASLIFLHSNRFWRLTEW